MSAEFPFEPDATRGQWIAERLDGSAEGEALSGAVPLGFDALVRVLHPFRRDRVVGGTFAELDHQIHDGTFASEPKIDLDSSVTWREVAAVHDTEFSPDALAYRLLEIEYGGQRIAESGDGWRYHVPEEGTLPAPLLGRIAAVLSRHTATPERGVAAVWEGWGGLLTASSMGFFALGAPSKLPGVLQRPMQALHRARVNFTERRRRFGTAAAFSALMSPRGMSAKGTGVLSKEAARGPRLELPHRSYVCFEAGIDDFAAETGAAWPGRAPWVDDPGSWWVQSPNLVWPDGREWVLLTEIDFDSTLIACSEECAQELLAADGVEAVLITRDTPLWRVS